MKIKDLPRDDDITTTMSGVSRTNGSITMTAQRRDNDG